MTKRLIFLLILFSTISSMNYNFSRINRFISSIEKKDSWSGTILIVIGDSIMYQRSCGFADYENKIPFTINTTINLCSTGKMFTGTFIVKLVQEGLLKFTDTIGNYFPELPYGSKITIHDLLTHSSGLGAIDRELPDFSYKDVTCCMDLLEFIKRDTLKFNPGNGTFYSNTGYFLLGALIEKIRGKPFQECIEDEIFEPLGMNNSFFKNDLLIDTSFRKTYNVAYEYEKIGKRKFVRWLGSGNAIGRDSTVILSAGGISMSAYDLYLFQRALVKNEILNKHYLDTMLTPYVDYKGKFHWAYGWIVTKSGSALMGNIGTNNFEYYPKENATIIVTQNCGLYINANKVAKKIERKFFKTEDIIDKIFILDRIFHSIRYKGE